MKTGRLRLTLLLLGAGVLAMAQTAPAPAPGDPQGPPPGGPQQVPPARRAAQMQMRIHPSTIANYKALIFKFLPCAAAFTSIGFGYTTLDERNALVESV